SPTNSNSKPRARARTRDGYTSPKGGGGIPLEDSRLGPMTDGVAGGSPSSSSDPTGSPVQVQVGGRLMSRAERLRKVRWSLFRAKRRLHRSIGHIADPRPGDLERWAAM